MGAAAGQQQQSQDPYAGAVFQHGAHFTGQLGVRKFIGPVHAPYRNILQDFFQ